MANDKSAQILEGDQLALAVKALDGNIISSGGAIDPTCLVDFQGEKQLAYKAVILSGGAGKPEYVDILPETGEEGVLYMVNSGVTRDGYAIFQMFSWHNNDWIAVGAFDVGINPTGIVYEQSFNASTNTWNVTVSQ